MKNDIARNAKPRHRARDTGIRKEEREHDIAETAADRQARKPAMNARVSAPSDAINLTALRLDVRNAIATAKITEFENQSHRLGHIIATGLLGRAATADLLLDVATSHGLVHEHGDDFIQKIMAEGLNCEARQ